MDFFYKNNEITIESEKKQIALGADFIDIDGLKVDMAGEYEKSGFLAYSHELAEVRIYQMRIEGYSIGFIPTNVSDLTSEQLDFLGDLDILVIPTSRASVSVLEKIEPSLLVTYGETAHELSSALGNSEPPLEKYRLKDVDLSMDKMGCVVLN